MQHKPCCRHKTLMGMDRRLTTAVLTGSRSDYGIYLPLLKALRDDKSFDLRLLVFGTHLSERYGMTVRQIEEDGFNIFFRLETLSEGDNPGDITLSMARTMSGFTPLWDSTHFDLIFALGDRYEMFAAVASALPFNIPVAHIHGGETTRGAIDNAFRHAITSMAKYHFTSADSYRNRVIEIIGSGSHVFNVGALSIGNLRTLELLSIDGMKGKYGIDFSLPAILITFHPETVGFQKNKEYIDEIIKALEKLDSYQQVITMPNADTMGLLIRNRLKEYCRGRDRVFCIESFGTPDYLSAIKYCSLMLGNSSSGFVEASYFAKPVINLGERQTGRIITPNIQNIPVTSEAILRAVNEIKQTENIKDCQIYGEGDTAREIIRIIKKSYSI